MFQTESIRKCCIIITYTIQINMLLLNGSYLRGSQRLRRVELNRGGKRETGRGVSTLRASSPGHATAKRPPGALGPVGWSLAESSEKDTSNIVWNVDAGSSLNFTNLQKNAPWL